MMNKTVLKWILAKNKIKGCSKCNLGELRSLVNRLFAAKTIQRYFRRWLYFDATDPITLDPVSHPCFIFCTSFGKRHFYGIRSLVEYIISSGKTVDPMTREQYNDKQLKRLDQLAKCYCPETRYRSTLKIKNDPRYYRRIQQESNELAAFQMRYSELRMMMLTAFEVYTPDSDFSFMVEEHEYNSLQDYITVLVRELRIIISHMVRLGINQNDLTRPIINDINTNTTLPIVL